MHDSDTVLQSSYDQILVEKSGNADPIIPMRSTVTMICLGGMWDRVVAESLNEAKHAP